MEQITRRGSRHRDSRCIVADAGGVADLSTAGASGDLAVAAVAAVSRLGNLRQSTPRFSFWMQLRGTTQVEASEGSFRLRRGDWIAFHPESAPELQADRTGLAIGVLLSGHAGAMETARSHGLFPGRGRMSVLDARLALRLWRAFAAQPQHAGSAHRAGKPLLLHLGHLQRDLHALLGRCPGRTAARKTQVLSRMQRARMLMEGNMHRSVRLGEIARLIRFSDWWVSKTFHAVYGETAQQASVRMRMQRVRELLVHTSLSISELGDACGFHDPCGFARMFKQQHGQTASRWRAMHQARGQT